MTTPASRRAARTISSPAVAHDLIGRDLERAFFGERLDAALRGEGCALVLLGDAGVGKSRMLREWIALAAERAFVCAAAENFEHATEAFAAAAQAVGTVLEREPHAWPAAHAPRRLLERLTGRLEESDESAQPWQKRRLFDAVDDALQRASERHPLLVCIDDAQWADPESLEVATFLASRLERRRAILILSARTSRTPHPEALARAIEALERLRWCHRVALRPLSERDTRGLVTRAVGKSRSVSAQTIDEICRRSEGVPLFAESLVRDALHGSPGAPSLPASVAQTVERQMATLRAEDAEAIEIASALGLVVEFPMFADVSARSDDDATRVLRRARDAGLLAAGEHDGRLRFTHHLVRDAVYARLLPSQRRQIHRRIAERMEAARDGSPAMLAHHWREAGDLERAAPYAVAAGEDALGRYAFASARDQFEAALACGVLEPAQRARVSRDLGTAYHLLGDAQGAYRCFEDALALYRDLGAQPDALAVLLQLASAAEHNGDMPRALGHAADALAEAAPGSREQFMANVTIAFHWMLGVDVVRAEPYVEAAEAYAGSDRDTLYVVRMHLARASVAFFHGRYDEWRANVDAAGSAAQERGDPTPIVSALLNMAMLAVDIGLGDPALEATTRAQSLADEFGLRYYSVAARLILADIWNQRGELERACAAFLEHRAYAVDADSLRFLASYFGVRLGLATGNPILVDEYLAADLLETVFASRRQEFIGLLGAVHADAAARRGQRRDAERTIARVFDTIESPQWVDEELVTLARLAADDDLERLEAFLDRPYGTSPVTRALRMLAQAALAMRLGKKARARALAQDVAIAARDLRRPLVEAAALEILGDASAALAIYEAAGARGDAARLDADARRGVHDGSALTKRQREIARLVAAGTTNRDIAEQLSISVRTVEHHVAAILAKRAVRSRGDL